MFKDDGQHLIDVSITRREAMKKIGKYGIYVPATMAVLSAAPRAFAQSVTCELDLQWSVVGDGDITATYTGDSYFWDLHGLQDYNATSWTLRLVGDVGCLEGGVVSINYTASPTADGGPNMGCAAPIDLTLSNGYTFVCNSPGSPFLRRDSQGDGYISFSVSEAPSGTVINVVSVHYHYDAGI